LGEVAGRFDVLAATLPSGLPDLLARECRHSVAIARWTCERAILRHGEVTETLKSGKKAMAERFTDLIEEHRKLWLARSRYGGLEDSMRQYVVCGIRG
jgi:hypothetical protein